VRQGLVLQPGGIRFTWPERRPLVGFGRARASARAKAVGLTSTPTIVRTIFCEAGVWWPSSQPTSGAFRLAHKLGASFGPGTGYWNRVQVDAVRARLDMAMWPRLRLELDPSSFLQLPLP
jgi:hypothetical protein